MTVNAAIAVRSEVACARPSGAASCPREISGSRHRADTHGFSLGGRWVFSPGPASFPGGVGVESGCPTKRRSFRIGASSALLVALMLATGRMTGIPCRRNEIAGAAMEIEAAHLKS